MSHSCGTLKYAKPLYEIYPKSTVCHCYITSYQVTSHKLLGKSENLKYRLGNIHQIYLLIYTIFFLTDSVGSAWWVGRPPTRANTKIIQSFISLPVVQNPLIFFISLKNSEISSENVTSAYCCFPGQTLCCDKLVAAITETVDPSRATVYCILITK